MISGSRCGSAQILHGSLVSRLPQVVQLVTALAALSIASARGIMIVSRFFSMVSAARRAERGPSPGSLARSWISLSISVPAKSVLRRNGKGMNAIGRRGQQALPFQRRDDHGVEVVLGLPAEPFPDPVGGGDQLRRVARPARCALH